MTILRNENENYTLERIEKRVKDDQFRSMTNEAKALYMILLERSCLSECNGGAWRDENGATFIIFTINKMMKLLYLGNKMLKKPEAHNLIY